MNRTLDQFMSDAIAFASRFDAEARRGHSAFNRAVLFIVLAVASVLSCHDILIDQTSLREPVAHTTTPWVYPSLAILAAISLVVHQRLPGFSACVSAVPTIALGASFVILDFRTRLGWIIVAGTVAASTPLIVLELFKTFCRRAKQVSSTWVGS